MSPMRWNFPEITSSGIATSSSIVLRYWNIASWVAGYHHTSQGIRATLLDSLSFRAAPEHRFWGRCTIMIWIARRRLHRLGLHQVYSKVCSGNSTTCLGMRVGPKTL